MEESSLENPEMKILQQRVDSFIPRRLAGVVEKKAVTRDFPDEELKEVLRAYILEVPATVTGCRIYPGGIGVISCDTPIGTAHIVWTRLARGGPHAAKDAARLHAEADIVRRSGYVDLCLSGDQVRAVAGRMSGERISLEQAMSLIGD